MLYVLRFPRYGFLTNILDNAIILINIRNKDKCVENVYDKFFLSVLTSYSPSLYPISLFLSLSAKRE